MTSPPARGFLSPRMHRWLTVPLLLSTGCAVRASYFLVDAERAWQEAVDAGAETAAPYEYTLAHEYLLKAREEAGYSDYQVAEQLAKQAVDAAERATRMANEPRNLLPLDAAAVPEEVQRQPAPAEPSPPIDLDLDDE